MASRFVLPTWQLLDANGDPLAGAKLNFYVTGGLVRKDTFSNSGLTVANANPVVANAAGRFGDIFLESGTYRVILTDSADVEIWDADPVDGAVGSSGAVIAKTGAYTVTVDDATKVIAVDATSGAVTITLLDAATAGDGYEIGFRKTDSSANAVTIDANGAELIDGAATFVLNLRYQSVRLRCDGTGWHAVGGTRVKTADIDALAVTTAKLADDAVTTAKLADDAVTSAKLDRSLFRAHLAGLALSNNGTDAAHDIDIAAGVAMADDQSAFLDLGTAIAKQIDAAWAVGTDAGGLDTGTVANSTWYAVWLIRRSDTGVVDALFSTSFSAPTMPTSYDQKRRIGAVLTDGSANILAFAQYGDHFYWDNPPTDHNTTISATESLITLSVPPNTMARLSASISANNGQAFYGRFYPTALSDLAVGAASRSNVQAKIGAEVGGSNRTTSLEVHADSSRQINAKGNTLFTVALVTHGWIDRRGRDD